MNNRRPVFHAESLRVAVALAVGMALFLPACTDGVTVLSEPLVAAKGGKGGGSSCSGLPEGTASIRLSPAAITGMAGETGSLRATNQDGVSIPSCALKWASSDRMVARVDGEGVVAVVAAGGPILLTAQTIGRSPIMATATLNAVTGLPSVWSLSLSPSPGVLVVIGEQVQFSTEAQDAQGNVLWGNYPLVWSHIHGAATVSPTGLMTAVAGGTAYVQVNSGAAYTQAKVSVNPGRSVNVICHNTWGWGIFGDCNQGVHPVETAIEVRFRVVDAANVDIPGATMDFEVDPTCLASCVNPGGVSPIGPIGPDPSGEFVTTWTLGPNAGQNRLVAWANVTSRHNAGVGIWSEGRVP